MQDDNKTLVNGLETGIDGIKFIPKSPKIESEEFVQVFKSDSVDDMAKKIIYKFKIGQSCTITGMVIASGKGYREATQSDILADEDMMKKGEVVLASIKTKQKSQNKEFGFKIGDGTRVSIWRKK